MGPAVAVRSKNRVAWGRVRREPATAIWAVALVLLALMLVHRHGGGSLSGPISVHAVTEDAAMMAIMMMVLAGPSAKVVAQRSLRSRWVRSVGEHVAGFAAVWFAYGVVAAIGVRLLARAVGPTIVLVLLLAAAATWQLSAVRRRRIARCGRVRTAPPTGWRADVGTLTAGTRQAVGCVTTCWASMLAMIAAPHPVVMGTVFAASVSEWRRGPNPLGSARRRRPAAVYLALAVGTLLLTVARLGLAGE